MPRPPFSIRTPLWLTLVVAAFLGGTLFERERAKRERELAGERMQREFGAAIMNMPPSSDTDFFLFPANDRDAASGRRK